MTRDEILNMPAGRDMDAIIAVAICGWNIEDFTAISPTGSKYSRTAHGDDDWLPYYSTDIAAAWQVVEHFVMLGRKVDLITISPVAGQCFIGKDMRSYGDGLLRPGDAIAEASTPPLAICRAALLAVMENK